MFSTSDPFWATTCHLSCYRAMKGLRKGYFGVLNTVESRQGTVGRELGGQGVGDRNLGQGTADRELGGTGVRELGAANWGQGI